MAVINLEKTDVALIYYEARGHSELTRQIYGERFPQRIQRNLCKRCAASSQFRTFRNE
jgi:hypothetical protein